MAAQPDAAAWQRKHDALLALWPLGIVTMNIDELHECQLRRKGWRVVCPLDKTADADFRDIVRSLETQPFILQAHGALTRRRNWPHHGLVFTWEAYRYLIMNRPSYVGFMAYLFMSCNFVFIGYGLSDLDFDQLLWGDAARFGAATRDHVVFQRWRSGSSARATAERRRLVAASSINAMRYGIHTVWVDDWPDVTDALESARASAGPRLEQVIRQCFSSALAERRSAHEYLRQLGEAGKAIATERLLKTVNRPDDPWETDEGHLHPRAPRTELDSTRRRIAAALLAVAKTSDRVSPVAHALGTLQNYVDKRDLPELEAISRRVRSVKLREGTAAWERDPDDRVPVYAEYLIRRVRARHEIMARRPDNPNFR